MDFDAEGVYADLDGVISFFDYWREFGSRWRLLKYDPNSSIVLYTDTVS
jgi:hypothetical protein